MDAATGGEPWERLSVEIRARDLRRARCGENRQSAERLWHLGELLTLIFARRRAEFCSQGPSLCEPTPPFTLFVAGQN